MAKERLKRANTMPLSDKSTLSYRMFKRAMHSKLQISVYEFQHEFPTGQECLPTGWQLHCLHGGFDKVCIKYSTFLLFEIFHFPTLETVVCNHVLRSYVAHLNFSPFLTQLQNARPNMARCHDALFLSSLDSPDDFLLPEAPAKTR